ncbi:uncharacterized protein LOC134769437 [Penaeus indicus]|uniref:uncharacterized protein LOC134769437 n=1 Tax=Penaeus indicus TaxID=29960 RepID=UPI00300C3EF8
MTSPWADRCKRAPVTMSDSGNVCNELVQLPESCSVTYDDLPDGACFRRPPLHGAEYPPTPKPSPNPTPSPTPVVTPVPTPLHTPAPTRPGTPGIITGPFPIQPAVPPTSVVALVEVSDLLACSVRAMALTEPFYFCVTYDDLPDGACFRRPPLHGAEYPPTPKPSPNPTPSPTPVVTPVPTPLHTPAPTRPGTPGIITGPFPIQPAVPPTSVVALVELIRLT